MLSPMPETTSPLVVAVDQGTSSTKAVVMDAAGRIVSSATAPVGQRHPQPGWVEQDAAELMSSVRSAVGDALAHVNGRVATIGLSTQRESAVAWDRRTGEPLGPVLGWQDRRTGSAATGLTSRGAGDEVRRISGLPIDPMFSALKFGWLLDEVDPDRRRSAAGDIALGTVDGWLSWCLTGEHRIETGNASRTQLLNLGTGDWSTELLELFGIPRAALPDIVPSDAVSGPVSGVPGVVDGVRIGGVLGDSHAALYGHGARMPGDVKVTYGTGSSVMGLLPGDAVGSAGGLVRTIAWRIGDRTALAFEGNILSTGATLVWLAELLGTTPSALAALAAGTPPAHGIDLVPAFAGLGAPWWDESARAVVVGFDLGTRAPQLARAAMESIVLQVEDVLAAADDVAGIRVDRILADGGPSSNDWLMQLQADLSARDVIPSSSAALSAVGVAHLAGATAGMWDDRPAEASAGDIRSFSSALDPAAASARRARWRAAVELARTPPKKASTP